MWGSGRGMWEEVVSASIIDFCRFPVDFCGFLAHGFALIPLLSTSTHAYLYCVREEIFDVIFKLHVFHA